VGQEQVLADRYTLLSPLGRGGMGQVWEALDTRLNRKVAAKLLTAGAFAAGPGFGPDVRRFTREATVTARLVHPSVPAIFDAGTYDGGLYLVMELVDGCTIGDLVAEQGPLPVAWAAGIAGQVAAVLAIAHQHEILHRDIKPQNVMLTRDGTAKVLDFGVAGIVSQRITSTGVAVGTPGYMAPEQLHNLPATPRTDLYGLGCLLYEMLAGQPVFTATSPAALMRMSLEQAPPPLHRRDVPPQLETLLWQLLDKNPARRPGDARQVYDQLLPFVAPPGPLGDIDPRAWSRTGMQLYARLLSRLSGADRGSAYPSSAYASEPYPSGPHWNGPTTPGTRHDMQAPNTRGDAGWTVRHSLWLLPTLLLGGLGAWLSFAYIAVRHQRLPWLGAAAAYLALSTVAFTLAAVGPDPATGALGVLNDIGACLLLALWPATIIHALWVNFKSRLPLLRASPASAASAAAASAAS
jgi:serine/threonine protein kinase